MQLLEVGDFVLAVSKARPPHVVWDIETGPESNAVLMEAWDDAAVQLPTDPGEWNPAAIKTGHLTDPTKIAAKLSTAYSEYLEKTESYRERCELAKGDAWDAFVDSAPLDSLIARVVAIGYGLQTEDKLVGCVHIANEDVLLQTLHTISSHVERYGGLMVGHHTAKFDLPFVTRRSWKHGLHPQHPITRYGKPRDCYVDTEVWYACGDYRGHASLNKLCKFLGVPGKYEGLTGADFWKALRDGHRDEAIEYLAADIEATYAVAVAMGVLR
jgi:hypothetical protein